PPVSAPSQRAIVDSLKVFVKLLYERAFLVSAEPTTPRPSPSLLVTERIEQYFTTAARGSLRAHPDVFLPGDGVELRRGRIVIDGTTTVDRRTAQSFLD